MRVVYPTERMQPLSPPPRRVVVRQVNWLGDIVMSQPALRAVRRAYPEAELTLLVRADLAPFFRGAGWIDEVLPFRIGKGWRGLVDQTRLVAALRQRRFDLAILFPDSFQSALWFVLAGIPERIGYARDARSMLLTRSVARTPATLRGHQVHYRLHMLHQALGIDGDPADFALDVDAAARERMVTWLAERRRHPGAPLIALAAGAAYGPAKEWPAASFAGLIDQLAEEGTEAVLVGGPGERQRCEEIAGIARAGALVAAGATDIAELIALLSLCDGFAGNDSGGMHVAGALGLPTVGIFGSTRPDRTAPLGARTKIVTHAIECSPCLQRTCRFGHYRCLTEIAPAEVAAALAEAQAG